MGVGLVDSNDLDEFVAECDRRGGIADPETIEYLADFSLSFSTQVDGELDGYSAEARASELNIAIVAKSDA